MQVMFLNNCNVVSYKDFALCWQTFTIIELLIFIVSGCRIFRLQHHQSNPRELDDAEKPERVEAVEDSHRPNDSHRVAL